MDGLFMLDLLVVVVIIVVAVGAAQKGSNVGKWFWTCMRDPKCRKVLAVEVG